MNQHEKFRIVIPPQDITCEPGIVQKLADGDTAAFAWVYKNYCGKVFDYAMLLTNSKALSEDIVQDVFVKLWMRRERLKGIENFNGFLYLLYRNQILDVLRKQKRQKLRCELYCNSEVLMITPAADEVMIAKERNQIIQTEIRNLPQQQQLVFTFVKEYGLKRTKVAEELKLSENTIKNHLSKAVGKLKERLKAEL